MNKTTKIIVSFLIYPAISFLSACGGSSSNEIQEFSNKTTSYESFNGTWQSGCISDLADGVSVIESTNIDGTSSIVDVNVYNSTDCTGSYSTTTIKAKLKFGNDAPTASPICSNTKEVDYTIISIVANGILLSSNEVLEFIEQPSNVVFDLMCTSDNQLFRGELTQQHDGSTAESRPIVVDHEFALNRA